MIIMDPYALNGAKYSNLKDFKNFYFDVYKSL